MIRDEDLKSSVDYSEGITHSEIKAQGGAISEISAPAQPKISIGKWKRDSYR